MLNISIMDGAVQILNIKNAFFVSRILVAQIICLPKQTFNAIGLPFPLQNACVMRPSRLTPTSLDLA
jgi:hypothetical protein